MINLNNINNPDFLKKLNNDELSVLSNQIRNFIIDNVSKTGGHLSSNLGIVDLTIALLKVFDVNKDKIIFDVGHECYPYKILTGRASKFKTLRKLNGLNGFQKMSESKYDHYEAGHSSTSLSVGLGFALARDLDNKKHNVICVIGDGSISNGLCYEALNHIGSINTRLIIILNDNEMSISQNVGALHNFLDQIRGSKNYNNAKTNTKNLLNKTKIGNKIASFIDKTKNNIKMLYIRKGSFFTSLGLEYYGPINGHDYKEMLKYLEIVKNEDKPVILHVITKKGLGYKPSEEDTDGTFHGVEPFNISDGSPKNLYNLPTFSEVISSYVFNFAKKDKDIICITPAMSKGAKLEVIKEKLPKQFIDVGINEEHSLLLANGLAINNKKPIVFMYSTFLQRGYDEIVHDIARLNQHVIICVDRAGFVSGDGDTHQGLFDIPFLISVPNIVLSMPKDAKEANSLLYTALNEKLPFVIRYPKINIKYDFNKPEHLKIGSWEVVTSGEDGVIITYGDFVSRAQNIVNQLKENDNINLTIINARFIKPIDENMLIKLLKYYKKIFIYEESIINSSLGSIICEFKEEIQTNNEIYLYGVPDKYMFTATREELIKLNELDEDSIYKKILQAYKK